MLHIPSPETEPTPQVEVRGCVGCGGPGCLGCVIPFGTALVLLVSLGVSWLSGPDKVVRPDRVPVVAVAAPVGGS